MPFAGERAFETAIGIPFAHVPLFWLFLIVRSLPRPFRSESDEYIRIHHPELWKRLRPWGPHSYNGFASLAFLFGKAGDRSDPELEAIRRGSRRLLGLYIWPFLLIAPSWLVALISWFGFASRP